MSKAPSADPNRLVAVTLDEESIGRSSPDIDHERSVAIYDLIEANSFAPVGHKSGPYALHLSLKENRLVFDIRREDGKPVIAHLLSLTPFKRIVQDAIKSKVEVDFDTARRLFTLICVLHWKG